MKEICNLIIRKELEDAPLWWQDGQYTKVIDYCINDVRLTKMLLDKILRFGHINNPIRPSEILRLRRP